MLIKKKTAMKNFGRDKILWFFIILFMIIMEKEQF